MPGCRASGDAARALMPRAMRARARHDESTAYDAVTPAARAQREMLLVTRAEFCRSACQHMLLLHHATRYAEERRAAAPCTLCAHMRCRRRQVFACA